MSAIRHIKLACRTPPYVQHRPTLSNGVQRISLNLEHRSSCSVTTPIPIHSMITVVTSDAEPDYSPTEIAGVRRGSVRLARHSTVEFPASLVLYMCITHIGVVTEFAKD